MKLIRNATVLKALPVGAIVADDADTCWEKLPNGRWQLEDEDFRGEGSESLMEVFGPFEVVWCEGDPAVAPHDSAVCGSCDDHADATVQADRDETALDGAL